MKTFKKFMVGILAIVATLGGVGCNSPQGINPVEEVDTTRTQLYVSNYNGGYGDMWLRAAKTRFEEEFAEVSFETGKKGVQVMIDNAKESADAIKDKLAYSRNQVIFQEGIDYYEYVQKGVALDITDMIKETLPGETESIYDKMTPEQKEGLKITTADGKDHYFMVPHYESFYGVVVDLDLLDSKRLMLGSDGEFNYKTTDTAMLSKGPDGKDGTYDDGFPATYAEFKALCTNMVERGVTPFGWSGEFQMYITNAMMAWSADTMGAEETNINLTMEGTSNLLVKSVDSNGNPVLESKEITPETGYEVYRQVGSYYTLQLMKKIIDNGWYSKHSFTSTQSHTSAQTDYLLSAKATNSPVAMLPEGCWWQNEASATFEEMIARYGDSCSKQNRRFMFMPVPKATEAYIGNGQTMVEINSAYGFINSNIAEEYKPLALKFLQYCNTDISLREFTKTTDTPKALKYEIDAEDLSQNSYFCQKLMELRNLEDTTVLYAGLATDPQVRANRVNTFLYRYGNLRYTYPSLAFKDDKYDLKKYFDDILSYQMENWNAD